MLQVGDTFLLPSRQDGTPHLWIVLTKARTDGKAVCVNITTRRPSFCETTVILSAGEHPFVVHESVVQYKDANFLDLNALETGFAGRFEIVCSKKEPASKSLLEKIQKGLLASKHTPNYIKVYCRNEWQR